MHPHITQALAYLQSAYYAGYFEEMEKVNLPTHLRNAYATLQNMFTSGQPLSFDFSQRLETLAKQIGKALGETASQITPSLETFKAELTAILTNKQHLGISDILIKIDANLAPEQYDRVKWVSLNSKSAIALELLAQNMVQETKSLINSIR